MLSSSILFVFEHVFVFIEKEGNSEHNYLGWAEKKGQKNSLYVDNLYIGNWIFIMFSAVIVSYITLFL